MTRKNKTGIDKLDRPLTMSQGLMLDAVQSGALPVGEAEDVYRATMQSARERIREVGRITRPLLNAMLMESYDHAKTSTERIAAVKELGKMNGLYAPERQIKVSANATLEELGQLSDEELMRIARGEGEILDGEFEVDDDN